VIAARAKVWSKALLAVPPTLLTIANVIESGWPLPVLARTCRSGMSTTWPLLGGDPDIEPTSAKDRFEAWSWFDPDYPMNTL
jgi:hypothetical protein